MLRRRQSAYPSRPSGRVCFLQGRVRLVMGGAGKPPSKDLLDENELRRLLRIVSTTPGLWGEEYSPVKTISVVNALQPLGKEAALP